MITNLVVENNTNLVLHFWRPGVQNEFHWLKSCVGRATFCPEALERNQSLCLFRLLEAIHIPWLIAPFLAAATKS